MLLKTEKTPKTSKRRPQAFWPQPMMDDLEWAFVGIGGLFVVLLSFCLIVHIDYHCTGKRDTAVKELIQPDGQRILVDHRGVKHSLHFDTGQHESTRESMSAAPDASSQGGAFTCSTPFKLVHALDDVEASPNASARKDAPPSVRSTRNETPSSRSARNAALPSVLTSVRREASLSEHSRLGKSDASLTIQKMTRGKLARGKVERLHLAKAARPSGKIGPALASLEAKDPATVSSRKRASDMMKKEAQMVQSLRTQAAEHLQMVEKIDAAIAGSRPGPETVRAARAMAEGFRKEADELLRLIGRMESPETTEARRRNNEVVVEGATAAVAAVAARQTERVAAWEALRAKLEHELEAEQAIENAAREAREQLEAARVMGVFVRRLLARRKGGKLKQQRLLKNPDHIDKAIMNGQGRAKLAEMREQKEKMNAYLTKMTC